MKIVVLVKQVPDTETKIKLTADNSNIETAGVKYVVNPYDEFAVEEAVRLKEKNPGSTITVVGMGPERTKEALRTALAMGADEGLYITEDNLPGKDGLITARLLAEAVKTMNPDLVLCGKQAIDDDEGRVGPALSHYLNLPFVTNVIKLTLENGKLNLQRELEGRSEILEVALPAVVSAQKGLNEPRYPSLINIMQAKKKTINEMKPEQLLSAEELEKSALTQQTGLNLPPMREKGRKLQGDPNQLVQEIVTFLTETVKIS